MNEVRLQALHSLFFPPLFLFFRLPLFPSRFSIKNCLLFPPLLPLLSLTSISFSLLLLNHWSFPLSIPCSYKLWGPLPDLISHSLIILLSSVCSPCCPFRPCLGLWWMFACSPSPLKPPSSWTILWAIYTSLHICLPASAVPLGDGRKQPQLSAYPPSGPVPAQFNL